jgi:hypothetical protein
VGFVACSFQGMLLINTFGLTAEVEKNFFSGWAQMSFQKEHSGKQVFRFNEHTVIIGLGSIQKKKIQSEADTHTHSNSR